MAPRRKVARCALDGDNREGKSSTGQVASKAVGEKPGSDALCRIESYCLISFFLIGFISSLKGNPWGRIP